MNASPKATITPELRARLMAVLSPREPDNPAQQQWLAELRREQVARPAIFVGAGTCGLGAGAAKSLEAINAWLAQHKQPADIVQVGCIGLCVEEPLVDLQLPGRTRVSFKKVNAESVNALLDAVFAGRIPREAALVQFRQDGLQPWPEVPFIDEHPFFGPQTRWVMPNCGLVDPARIEEYVARGGYRSLSKVLHKFTRLALCDLVEASGLRGRGGGGFPTGAKWKFALNAEADRKYLICNADEGDPGAFMNRALMEGDPHRLVEGMAIAAYAIGADRAFVYVRAEKPLAGARVAEAIEQARQGGLLGENIFDSGFNLQISVRMGAGAFVCGEETALIHSVEGKRGMPRPRPPFPAVQGVFGKPTVINNVETLANLPAIVERGSDWFRSVGTANCKGTKIFALSGKVARTGLVEVAMGTSVRRIVMEIGGGCPDGKAFKAVQVGGPSGGCVPAAQLDTPVDYESLRSLGAIMGSGGMVVMDEATCMVDVAKFFMDFIQRESCGKCIPCREGTRRMLEILQRTTRGRRADTGLEALERFQGVMHLESLAQVIRDTSLCGLGQTAPNPVLSTLRWFRDEYEAHLYDHRCPAGVCTELLTYTIAAQKCVGCGICSRKCPSEAILGAPKSPHYIVPDKCLACGSCVDACPKHAITAA